MGARKTRAKPSSAKKEKAKQESVAKARKSSARDKDDETAESINDSKNRKKEDIEDGGSEDNSSAGSDHMPTNADSVKAAADENFSDESKEKTSEGTSDDSDSSSDSGSSDDEKRSRRKEKFFSDENAKWLKPKNEQALLSSNEDEDNEILGEDDSEEEMEIEKESRLLDAKRQEEEEEAEGELRENIRRNTAIYHLPTLDELEKDVDRVIPPSELKSHVDSILEVLADFKQRREPGRTRSEYVERLGFFLAELYGYLPELVEYFLTMFSPSEALEFIDYSEKPRPMVIRTNTLKSRRKDLALALMKRGVTLDPLASWSKVGLKIIESPVPIGATPEYLSGHYMLQSAASMCPVLALDPQPNERVLDMSAAPGGKTSYIAQLMRNTGVVFANDLKPDRQKATVANMHRLGVKNVVTCTHDGRKMPKLFRHYKFDRVLLDAPCSGLGVISRDPSCKVQRTLADIQKTAHLQKELLLAALDVLNHKSKNGGVMVYSTCSVSVAENEEVVNYALQKRDIKIVDTGLDFGKPGFTRYQEKRFHPSVALARRFYPHVHNMDGFFICKIRKLSNNFPSESMSATGESVQKEVSKEKGGGDAETDKGDVQKEKKREKVGKLEKGKKRKVDQDETKAKQVKADKLSVPPAPPVKKSKATKQLSAKVTKPRRIKTN